MGLLEHLVFCKKSRPVFSNGTFLENVKMSNFQKPEILFPKIVKKRRSLHNAVVSFFGKITWLQPLFWVFDRRVLPARFC